MIGSLNAKFSPNDNPIKSMMEKPITKQFIPVAPFEILVDSFLPKLMSGKRKHLASR